LRGADAASPVLGWRFLFAEVKRLEIVALRVLAARAAGFGPSKEIVK
jgi:hypothetical protein